MPHTHQKGVCDRKAKGVMEWMVTHTWLMRWHTQMVWQSEVTMQVLMHTTVSTHWPHHTTLPSMCVCVEVAPRVCGVTMVVAHQSVDEPSNCFAVPPITVTVVCVCQSGVEVAMIAMPHTP